MIWDQNYRYNIPVRKALETILSSAQADKTNVQWEKFMLYAKRVFFASGLHHHYGSDKFLPEFDRAWFEETLKKCGGALPVDAVDAMFSPTQDMKKVNLDPKADLIRTSAVNFYERGITQAEVEAFYKKMMKPSDQEPPSFGINSYVRKEGGKLTEDTYKSGGRYGAAIDEVIKWLTLAVGVAENEKQKNALMLLIDFYKTGDIKKWDEFNIAWTQATEGDIDYIQGFVEVYNDPLGYKGSYESVVQIKDFDASAQMKVLGENAQWFEDNSPILPQHKKEKVTGVTYKVVTVAGEAGDAAPATPIGVNLPNANWIRVKHGSKSVSLGNIEDAYNNAAGPGMIEEFNRSAESKARATKYGSLAHKLSTALHEVIGHASGQIRKGVGTPKETLKNYASALEEARADLVALYYIIDPKMMELGLVPDADCAKAEYDDYINNGLMKQLRRIEPGKNIEEAHMRNRQLIAQWVYEHGKKDSVVQRIEEGGKTYFVVRDYLKMRTLTGELLREVQRVISEGDYKAGRDLIENYGVKVDKDLHAQVLERVKKLNMPPYSGFIQPRLVPVQNEKGDITEVKVEYPNDFIGQMLEFGKNYSFLK
jgi:dipeptidyl-peptidase-3